MLSVVVYGQPAPAGKAAAGGIEARKQLARACERVENWLCAVEQYQALSDLKPDDAEYLYLLGRAYTRLAEWSYRRMIAIDPDSARLHQALGQQFVAQGKYDLALAEFRRAARVDPKLPEIHLAMALIFLELKDYAAAAREIELELALAPESRPARELKQRIEERR